MKPFERGNITFTPKSPEQIVDPIITAFETIAKATVESDKTIVELVKGLAGHVDRTNDLLIDAIKTAVQHIQSLEAKVDMLMEMHRMGDDEDIH